MTDTSDLMATSEASMAEALRPFGWTCTEEFWQRYYSDAWVFNLANAVERQAAALRAARDREARWWKCYQCGDAITIDRFGKWSHTHGTPRNGHRAAPAVSDTPTTRGEQP